jgi:hypothetical protein
VRSKSCLVWLVVALLFLEACASRKPQVPASCGNFCSTIDRCAKESGHVDLSEKLCTIARCETGDKCRGHITSGSSMYHGPFQYSERTWNASCPAIFKRKGFNSCLREGSMNDVCCATICAAEMIDKGGIGNWPVCGKR